jgi:hypothetical protein
MVPNIEVKQIAVKYDEYTKDRLDRLARNGAVNRHHLMLSFINIWLGVLKNADMAALFHFAIILRDFEALTKGILRSQREIPDSRVPEKAFPIKLGETTIFDIERFASRANMSNHQLMKNMIIIGIEELENITDYKAYQFGAVEPKLYKSFEMIMKKGFKAFKAGIK